MARAETSERNADVVARYRAGESMTAIAEAHGLTRQRVYQILHRAGVVRGDEERRARAAAAREAKARLRQRFLDLAAKRPAMTSQRAADLLKVTVPELVGALRPEDRRFLLAGKRGTGQQYSDEQMLDALRTVAAELRTERLTRDQYDETRAGRGGLPSGARVMQRFGTWSEACRQAGLAVRGYRTGRERQWSRDDMLAAVMDYLREPGNAGTGWEYEVWRAGRDAPGVPTLRMVFGTWSAAKAEALDRMRREARRVKG